MKTSLITAAVVGLALNALAEPARSESALEGCPGDTLEKARACYDLMRSAALAHGHKVACQSVSLYINGAPVSHSANLWYQGTKPLCLVSATVPVSPQTGTLSGTPGGGWTGGMLSLPPSSSQPVIPQGPGTGVWQTWPHSTGLEPYDRGLGSDLLRGYPAMR